MDRCPNRGYEKPSYNSYRNRHCPKCQTFSKERWIDAQKTYPLHCSFKADTSGKMAAIKKEVFLPVQVLFRKFRGKFLALLKLHLPDVDQNLLNTCYRKEWVV